jgi:hypothetical protein
MECCWISSCTCTTDYVQSAPEHAHSQTLQELWPQTALRTTPADHSCTPIRPRQEPIDQIKASKTDPRRPQSDRRRVHARVRCTYPISIGPTKQTAALLLAGYHIYGIYYVRGYVIAIHKKTVQYRLQSIRNNQGDRTRDKNTLEQGNKGASSNGNDGTIIKRTDSRDTRTRTRNM